MTAAAMFRPGSRVGERLHKVLGDASTLRVIAEHSGSAMLLRVGGDVDASNVASLRRLLAEAAATVAPPGPLMVDTDLLDFIGACGLAALAEASKLCRLRGVSLRVIANQSVIVRTVAACHWQASLPVYPDLGSALDAHPQTRLFEPTQAGWS